MKVTVTKKEVPEVVFIGTDYIKLQDAMKLANLVLSGGEAKALIQEGQVEVAGEVCTMRGKKLYPGDAFRVHAAESLKLGNAALMDKTVRYADAQDVMRIMMMS